MTLFTEPKIDTHAHVFDPKNFPYDKRIAYHPSGQEIGTTAQLEQVMRTYGVKHALLVQPNSGYGGDNSCMLDAIERGEGRFKGIAIVDNDADLAALKKLKAGSFRPASGVGRARWSIRTFTGMSAIHGAYIRNMSFSIWRSKNISSSASRFSSGTMSL